jgi:hypothetical protein
MPFPMAFLLQLRLQHVGTGIGPGGCAIAHLQQIVDSLAAPLLIFIGAETIGHESRGVVAADCSARRPYTTLARPESAQAFAGETEARP